MSSDVSSSPPSHVNGRFAPGNKLGKGNPFAKQVSKLRAQFMKCASLADMKEVWTTMVQAAKDGQPWAVKELNDRIFGKAQQHITVEEHGTVLELVQEIISVNPNATPSSQIIDQAPPDPTPVLPFSGHL